MIDITEARALIGANLKCAGFCGRRSVWRLQGDGLRWVVHIDRLPYGQRLGVDIGLDLHIDEMQRRPTDCLVLLHLEGLPLARAMNVLQVVDLRSGLDDDIRRQQLAEVTGLLAGYLHSRMTLVEVKAAYRRGEFAVGFVHKDARPRLGTDGS